MAHGSYDARNRLLRYALLSAAPVIPFRLSQQRFYIFKTSSKEPHRYRYKRLGPTMIVVDDK